VLPVWEKLNLLRNAARLGSTVAVIEDQMRTWLLDCIQRTQDTYSDLCGAEHGR